MRFGPVKDPIGIVFRRPIKHSGQRMFEKRGGTPRHRQSGRCENEGVSTGGAPEPGRSGTDREPNGELLRACANRLGNECGYADQCQYQGKAAEDRCSESTEPDLLKKTILQLDVRQTGNPPTGNGGGQALKNGADWGRWTG